MLEINETRAYGDIRLTIEDITTSKKSGDAGVGVEWRANGSIIRTFSNQENRNQKRGSERDIYPGPRSYIQIGLSGIADPFNTCGLNPSLTCDGREVSLENFNLDFRKTGQDSATGAMGTPDYLKIESLSQINIPGIAVSLPVEREVDLIRNADGTYSAANNMLEFDGGRAEITRTSLSNEHSDQPRLEVDVVMHKESDSQYPVALDSYALVNARGKYIKQEGRALPDEHNASMERLYFIEPPDDSNLALKVFRVRYGLPGKWTIKLNDST